MLVKGKSPEGVSKRGADTISFTSGESCLNNDMPECRQPCKHSSLKRRRDFVPIVHAGVLSKALHEDGEVRTIIANLGDNSGYTAEDAPT